MLPIFRKRKWVQIFCAILIFEGNHMNTLPPLHLHLLAHPKSELANKLAFDLMTRFVEPPFSGGLRIPVFFTPDQGDDLPPGLNVEGGLNLDAAQHTIVVVLADARMLRTMPNGTGNDWKAFAQRAIALTPLDASSHHILPVALEQEAFHLSNSLHILPALLENGVTPEAAQGRRLAEISFHIAARAIQLLEHGKVPAVAPDRMKAPVTIFLSHAKSDLDRKNHDDPVRKTRDVLNELPVEQWYDVQQIAPGQGFADAIGAGIRDCSIMLAFQTDHYSSRPWCRREVLEAKQYGAHLLVVDALQSGEARSFPYGGNVPTLRWSFSDDSRLDAQRVIDRAVLEALRFKYNRALLNTKAEPGETVLPTAPEALTLANECGDGDNAKTFLYPDPPLGREELQVLQRLRPQARFLTPLTKIAQWPRPSHIEAITVSISASDDVRKYGLSPTLFETLSDEIHLYLLLAGVKIAYGGALKGSFSGSSNFTLRLFELVRAYSKLAEGVNARPLEKAIINVAPWPLRLDYGDDEWRLFSGDIADYEAATRPDVPWHDEQLFPPKEGSRVFVIDDTPERRYAWARGLSAMRERITELSQARLVIGGVLGKFNGLVPGVVEEAWCSLRHKRPVYIAGGFGGSARSVCDLLLGIERQEFFESWAMRNIPHYEAAQALFGQHGGEFYSMERIGAEIKALGQQGLASALNNGLDEDENRELMRSTDPQRVAGLVLAGLARL
jgi:hypothetical protein